MKRLKMGMVLLLLMHSFFLYANGSQEETVDDGPVTLDVLITTVVQNPEGPQTEKIIEAFHSKYPDIEINTIGVPMNDALTKIVTLATADQLPDLFVNTEGYVGQLYEMGILADLNKVMTKDDINGIIPAIRDAATINDELTVWPWYTVPQAVLYRADWLEETGLSAPKNWDEFQNVAKAMTQDSDGDGKIDRWGFGLVGTNNGSGQGRFLQVLRTFGARELYSEDGKWKTDIGSAESIAAFKYFAELSTVQGAVPPGVLENGFIENVNMMAQNQIGLFITGPHTTGKVFAQAPELKGKLHSIVIPEGTLRMSPLNFYGLSMNANSTKKEDAATFLRYLTSTENMTEWTKVTGRLPCFTEPSKSDYISGPMFKGFTDSTTMLETLPLAPFYSEVKNIMGQAYQSILLDASADVDAIVKKAGADIQKVIDRES